VTVSSTAVALALEYMAYAEARCISKETIMEALGRPTPHATFMQVVAALAESWETDRAIMAGMEALAA